MTAPSTNRFERARIYLHLRSAHLERAHELIPATILYATGRYDLDASLLRGLDVRQVGVAGLAATIARSGVRELEINEPLMRAALPRAVVAVLAARASGIVRRDRPVIVSYAIENKDPFVRLNSSLKHRGRLALDRRLASFVLRRIDRLAFGTFGARELYSGVLGPTNVRADQRLIEAVPAACDCGNLDAHDNERLLYLGGLHPRKGFEELIAAWRILREIRPNAQLTIVGKGALEDLATALAAEDPRVELIIDPPRAQVHHQLRRASALILLSQPTRTWREQVGLPIVEALGHGCTVVTTTETGLAAWLTEHNHTVLNPAATAAEVASAVATVCEQGRTAASVLADLPAQDGRLAADEWMFDHPGLLKENVG